MPKVAPGIDRPDAAERPVHEAAILSTCNRTELYFATDAPRRHCQWLADYHRLARHEIEPYLYTYPERDAVRHAFGWPAGSIRWFSASRRFSAR
jgi:glutamyl-tRNA reductase